MVRLKSFQMIKFPHLIIDLVSSKLTSVSAQLVQRIRLQDEEEHPTQNNIMIDEDLVQYYQLLADRGDAQAQVTTLPDCTIFIR